jgi:serine/threonine protein kinase
MSPARNDTDNKSSHCPCQHYPQQNIFAGDDGMFMIGDFGLSKMMKDANHHAVDIDLPTNAMILPVGDIGDIHHTAGVGTASYASPEQIESKSYGTAADVFSLGLIILELFSNFTSEHERAKAFLACRRDGELDSGLKHYFPELATLILACTNKDCGRRPTARDIQAEFQERSGDEMYRAEVRTLKLEIAKKDTLIQSQVEQMRAKDKQIENLQYRLASLESGMDATAVQDAARK